MNKFKCKRFTKKVGTETGEGRGEDKERQRYRVERGDGEGNGVQHDNYGGKERYRR